ncbi:MAG: porin [Gammaproteobacteria bacterium]
MTHAKPAAAARASRRPAKKILITAVAATLAPAAAHAQIIAYGRIASHIDINDTVKDNPFTPATHEGDTPKRFASINGSGRFGIKYDGNVGPGLNTHARYEFSTTTDKESSDAFVRSGNVTKSGTSGIKDIRIATAGISGLFGRIDIGNQWSSYFNTFGTLISPTYTLGSFLYSAVGGGAYRTSNTIKYSTTFGPVSAELDMRFNESDETADTAETLRGDGYGLGIRIAISRQLTLAFAVDSEERADGEPANIGTLGDFAPDPESGNRLLGKYPDYDAGNLIPDEDRLGISAKATFNGGYWLALGWQNYKTDDLPSLTPTLPHPLDRNDDGDTADPGEAPANQTSPRPGKNITSYFLYGGGTISPKTTWLLGYAQADDSRFGPIAINLKADELQLVFADQGKSEQITWGIYRNIGAGFNLYYEASRLESEVQYRDGFVHLLGMRVRF